MTAQNPTRKAEIAAARAADERIAAAWDLYWEAMKPVEDLRRSAKDNMKWAAYYGSRPDRSATYRARAEEATEQAAQIEADAAPLANAARALDAELYTGWQRFFLVEHIHATQHCSSFRPTTRVGWLPNVSGLTEAEAVAEYGAILCTICFPSAPTEWTAGKKDDSCTGSGKPVDHDLPERRGFAAGNWVTCPDCGKQVGITRNGYRIPKHKPQA